MSDDSAFTDAFGSGRGPGAARHPDKPRPAAPAQALTPIRHLFVGGVEDMRFIEFAELVVQDDEVALRVAQSLLDFPESPYEWHEGERFELLDADALTRQLADFKDAFGL